MQELLRKFVTDPETGDNRFITQSVFFNKNITCNIKGKKKVSESNYVRLAKKLSFISNYGLQTA